MHHGDTVTSEEFAAIVRAHDQKTLVRFVMCGSVDDGKSTLIGRLLYESHALFADHLVALEADSDVAYRHFSSAGRHFIVADCPGHEQCIRNIVSGASTADCAVVLVDARKGMLTQTRQHSYLVSLLGIRDVALAINKMDLIDYSPERFREIEREYRGFAAQLGLERVTCIPVSALRGDNVVTRSEAIENYSGPTLMEYLDSVKTEDQRMQSMPFRLPVQWVNLPDQSFRGYAGTAVSGTLRPGDRVVVAPSGQETAVARIVTYDGDLDLAIAGQAITVTLTDEIDVARGDVIAHVDDPPGVADQFQATIVWMGEKPMLPGRGYIMRVGSQAVMATISPLKYKLDVNTLDRLAATKLELNEIGVCGIELSEPIAFDSYRENRDTGGFVLIDRITGDTVGAGLLEFALRRSQNLRWQAVTVDKNARSAAMRQQPRVLWLTGLPGAGKSTIANLVEAELHRRGHNTYLLDGDNVRHGLNVDLGFTQADRVENIRRVAEVARLMVDAGLIVLVSFISPFRVERLMARSLFELGEFVEVYVDTPLAVAEERDPKGLYKKARAGELSNFTGVDSPYEPPERPEVRIDTTAMSAPDAARYLIEQLERDGSL